MALSMAVAFLFLTARRGCGCSSKVMAYRAMVKSDLRNLVLAESSALEQDSVFALQFDSTVFRPSIGVHVHIMEATKHGFTAEARHDRLPGRCVIFIGRPPHVPTVTTGLAVPEGTPMCDKETIKYR